MPKLSSHFVRSKNDLRSDSALPGFQSRTRTPRLERLQVPETDERWQPLRAEVESYRGICLPLGKLSLFMPKVFKSNNTSIIVIYFSSDSDCQPCELGTLHLQSCQIKR